MDDMNRTGGSPSRRDGRASQRTNFVKYASDNAVVRAVAGVATGPFKWLAICLVVALAVGALYVPVRDLYVSERSQQILTQQLALRNTYNKQVSAEVDSYLSREGIEQRARELGMVLPGEQSITVEGDGSSDDSRTNGSSTMSADDLDAAMRKVQGTTTWYTNILDKVFFFNGVPGQESATGK